jgi:hypothetical protein
MIKCHGPVNTWDPDEGDGPWNTNDIQITGTADCPRLFYQISPRGILEFYVLWIVTPPNSKAPAVSGKHIASIWKAAE